MIINWKVKNPLAFKIILQLINSVSHSILFKILFKKCQLLPELSVMFLQQKYCVCCLTKGHIWNKGEDGSTVESPPLEIFRRLVPAICAGCCVGPAQALHWAQFLCRPAERPPWLTVQLDFSICLFMPRLNTCCLLNPLKTFAPHGVKGSWSLDSAFGQFLTLQLNTLYKIHILSNTTPLLILFQIFL